MQPPFTSDSSRPTNLREIRGREALSSLIEGLRAARRQLDAGIDLAIETLERFDAYVVRESSVGPSSDVGDFYLDYDAAAAMLSMSTKTIQTYVQKRAIPFVRIASPTSIGHVMIRFRRSALQAWADAGGVPVD